MDRTTLLARAKSGTLALRLYFFASFAALGVYSPFFPRWLVARGIQGVAMGAVVATLPAMGVVGPPLVGLFADSLGLRGPLLRIACLGSFLAFAPLALAGLAHFHLTLLDVLAVVLVFAIFRAPMLLMADVVAMERDQDSGASYGKTRLFGSLGFLVATVAGGRFINVDGPVALPAVVAGALLLALLAACLVPVRSSGAVRSPWRGKLRSVITDPDYQLLVVLAFVAELGISSSELCYTLYLSALGASNAFIGFAWALGVGAEILMMAATASLLERFRAPPLIVMALCGVGLRCVLLAALRTLPALMALQLLHTPCVALLWTAAISHLKQRTSPVSFATAQGLFSAVVAAGSALGMLLWGAIFHRSGGAVTFASASVVAAGAALLALHFAARAGFKLFEARAVPSRR